MNGSFSNEIFSKIQNPLTIDLKTAEDDNFNKAADIMVIHYYTLGLLSYCAAKYGNHVLC